MVQTGRLGLVNFERAFIIKNKVSVENVRTLQKTVSEDHVIQTVFEDKITKLENSVLASDELAAKLVESDKALEHISAQVAYFRE